MVTHIRRCVLASVMLASTAAHAQPATAVAPIAITEYAARRAALGALAGDGAIVVLGKPEPQYDHEYFAQSPHLRYLTGWNAPFSALVILRTGAAQREFLFTPARNAATEVWTGTVPSFSDAQRVSGLPTRDVAELTPLCDSLLDARVPLRIVGELDGPTSPLAQAISTDRAFMNALAKRHPAAALSDGNRLVLQLRGQKSPAELALLQASIDITVRAHEEVMRMLAPGWNEFEVQALVEYTFRRNGADRPGFTTIAGSGDNATTLHYWRNDREIQAGELIVMDIGASYGGYSADVTRTVPVSGSFTTEQRAIYELVRKAQQASEQATRVGADRSAPELATAETLARGLASLGLIESPTSTYDCDITGQQQCPQVQLYYMHGVGHGIGLDVHDPDMSDGNAWLAGSVITIEPGVYVRRTMHEVLPDTPRNRAILSRIRGAVAKYAGIGVRIEDDYLLTPTGLTWLSRLPRDASEIEALMRAPRAATPLPRDPKWVEQYRRGMP
ncbi:MAG: aminopeptidase P N-terminal domain-containing protein [Gemmatimonadaceae bacterium]|nr:aminopeptidase P N-terminal domain-containing protein [Gemmatimonadaceae bacterium]